MNCALEALHLCAKSTIDIDIDMNTKKWNFRNFRSLQMWK